MKNPAGGTSGVRCCASRAEVVLSELSRIRWDHSNIISPICNTRPRQVTNGSDIAWLMPGARLKKALVLTLERDAPCPVSLWNLRGLGTLVHASGGATMHGKGGSSL